MKTTIRREDVIKFLREFIEANLYMENEKLLLKLEEYADSLEGQFYLHVKLSPNNGFNVLRVGSKSDIESWVASQEDILELDSWIVNQDPNFRRNG
jgi:hypothetical protein